ncbi:MAG: NUDIX domain-containing protein [Patescibacteria group bacterium]|nr:NUDIX domain-containing protein [Patescibacteria group bacterium]MDE1940774.1 NUDIX domain-containing protein [Patescibacteria group bacterium]MDE1967030.1 NUDIX domain-containing protein [Patescibacteria group bacterium]
MTAMKVATINFPIKDGKVYLSRKKEGFGAGRLNGYGGKVKDGETVAESAIRELQEEAGVTVREDGLEQAAIIDFYVGSEINFKCHVFFVHEWSGGFKESDEMAEPSAFDMDKLPVDEMWDGDRVWLPIVFSGTKIHGRAYYKEILGNLDRFEYDALT